MFLVYRAEDIRYSGINMHIQEIYVMANAYFTSKSEYCTEVSSNDCLSFKRFSMLSVTMKMSSM